MDPRRSVAFLVLLAILGLGCGNGSPGTDAGDVVDAADDGGFDVPMPAPPVLTPCPEGWVEVPPDEPDGVTTCDPWPDGGPAVLTPCPDGWREVTDPETGTVACDPWPESGYEECTAVDEAHFPGEPGCVRVGTACAPGDDWATDLPGDRPIRYVLAGAPAGGDGTRASPFGTIQEAMSGAPSGTVVALSKGTFDEVVVLPAGVTLWGACVAETLVASSVPAEDFGTINVWGRDVGVRNLRVSGRRPGLQAVGRFRTALVEDVVVAEATHLGWFVNSAAVVQGRSIVVRDTRSREAGRDFGHGLSVQEGGVVEVQRGVFERNRTWAILAMDAGTSVTIEDVVLRDTRSRERDRAAGYGLQVQDAATAVVRRSLFERNRYAAVAALHAATSLVLEDVVLRDTHGWDSDRAAGYGLQVQEGAAAEVRRGLFERNRDIAVVARRVGTSVTLEDVVVRDTQSQESDRTGGRGLSVLEGATAVVRHALFERNREVAVFAGRAGTSVVLEDVVVRDTQSQESERTGGRGLSVQWGATAEVRRGLFERNRGAAVVCFDAATSVTLEDVVVRDTQSQESDGTGGRGLNVQGGATAEVRRGLFERNRDDAVVCFEAATSVTLEDIVVRDTQSQESDGTGGRGLGVQGGATAEVRRALFERNRYATIIVGLGIAGASAMLEDVVVRDTLSQETGGFFGTGVITLAGGHAELRNFLVTGNALCGIQLAHGIDPDTGRFFEIGGTMDLYDGVVSHNAVCGANVQTDGFDLHRLQNNVRWHDNGIDLDRTEMPVPDVSAAGM